MAVQAIPTLPAELQVALEQGLYLEMCRWPLAAMTAYLRLAPVPLGILFASPEGRASLSVLADHLPAGPSRYDNQLHGVEDVGDCLPALARTVETARVNDPVPAAAGFPYAAAVC